MQGLQRHLRFSQGVRKRTEGTGGCPTGGANDVLGHFGEGRGAMGPEDSPGPCSTSGLPSRPLGSVAPLKGLMPGTGVTFT